MCQKLTHSFLRKGGKKLKNLTKKSLLGVILVMLSLVAIFLLNKTAPIKAADEKSSITVLSDEDSAAINVKVVLADYTKQAITMNYEGFHEIGSETLLESIDESFDGDLKVTNQDAAEKKLTFELSNTSKPLVLNLNLAKDETLKAKSGVLSFESEKKTLIQEKFVFPKSEDLEFESNEFKTDVVASAKSAGLTPFGVGDAFISDWSELKIAVADPTIDNIYLLKDIENPSPIPSARGEISLGTIQRPVTITGVTAADDLTPITRKIDFGNTGTAAPSRDVKGIVLGAVSGPTTLTLDHLSLKGTGNKGSLYNTATASLIYGNDVTGNWTVELKSYKNDPDGNKRLIYNQNGSILISSGENNLDSNFGDALTGISSDPLDANWYRLFESKSLIIDNQSVDNPTTVTGKMQDMLFTSSVTDSVFSVRNGSKVDIRSEVTGVASIPAARALMEFVGEGTEVKIDSNTDYRLAQGGTIAIDGEQSRIVVNDKANVELLGQRRPVTVLQSAGGEFLVDNESKVKIHQIDDGEYGTYGGAMRFRLRGDMTFTVTNKSVFEVVRDTGTASAGLIRMYGGGNKINVTKEAKFTASNFGDGNAQEAIVYASSSNEEFNLKDKNSKVAIYSKNGPGISSGTIRIVGDEGTEFSVDGGGSNAAFTTGVMDFESYNMLYYDFRNHGTGAIFDGGTTSNRFKNVYSDTSIWTKGSNLEGNPFKAWTLTNMGLYGDGLINVIHPTRATAYRTFTMNVITTAIPGNPYTTVDEVNDVLSVTATNMGKMSRVSGNNASPIVDELRVPTNADKYAFGHVTIPEGVEGFRDAWTDEVTVVLKVTKADGTAPYEINGKTVGAEGTSNGLSVYGEPERAGLFQIENKKTASGDSEFFDPGDKIEVVRAWRGGNPGDLNPDPTTVHLGKPGDFVPGDLKGWATPEVSIDVTPPTKPVVSTDLNNATKQLTGTSDEEGSKIFIKVNGAWLKDAGGNPVTTVVNSGKWQIDLPGYITKDDTVDVYLKDNTTITPLPAFVLPNTYTQEPDGVYGNINEEATNYDSYSGYHDAIKAGTIDERFDSATRLIVKDVIPDNPEMTKTVVSSGGTTTSVGDTLTYTLTAANKKAGSYDWKDVKLIDVLPEGLKFDPDKSKVTIGGTLAPKDKYTYEVATRTLTIFVGDLAADASVEATFEVTVDQSAVDQDIENVAKAIGDSPQESPFVSGPIDPTAPHEQIETSSNVIGLPGGPAFGTLTFVSAPKSLDFGQKVESLVENTEAVDPTIVGSPLVVADNRGVFKSWTLSAQLIKPLTNEDGKTVLKNAIYYKGKENGKEVVNEITGTTRPIVTHTHTSVGNYDISAEEWSKGDGFKIILPPGAVEKLGKYSATIEFTLADTK